MNKEQRNEYYMKQQTNLLFPNESYINSDFNKNKADLIRMEYVYKDNCELTGEMLDVGCNDGFFMRNFNWKFNKFLGIDMFSIEEYLGDLYKNNCNKYTLNGKIEYIKALFEDLEMKCKYDYIFAGEIIEHVYSVELFLNKIKSCLKKSGWVCFTTPNNIGRTHPEHARQYNKLGLEIELQTYFSTVIIKELPAINDSWPFLYAKCKI